MLPMPRPTRTISPPKLELSSADTLKVRLALDGGFVAQLTPGNN